VKPNNKEQDTRDSFVSNKVEATRTDCAKMSPIVNPESEVNAFVNIGCLASNRL
jgi:hypothetical protein